jgi:hypothetical protein
VNAFTAGVLLALLVAGYPLYELVTSGALDTESALLRGSLVAVACAAGVAGVVRLALGYEEEEERRRERKLDSLFTTMEEAVSDGSLQDEDVAAPATGTVTEATTAPADATDAP